MSGDLIFSDGTKLSFGNASYIVLAEDDLDDQEFFVEAFRQLTSDIKILTTTNGNKAAQVLDSLPADRPPQLIILDYNLPELNGADILKILQAKQQFQNVPKVVWSTSNSPVYEKICMDLGAIAYVVKPSDVGGIEQLAKHMLHLCCSDESS